jgi:tetratricopeptide (TPR) repeat protein
MIDPVLSQPAPKGPARPARTCAALASLLLVLLTSAPRMFANAAALPREASVPCVNAGRAGFVEFSGCATSAEFGGLTSYARRAGSPRHPFHDSQGGGGGAAAGPSVDAQVQQGFNHAYNLDHEEALTILKQAAAQDPSSVGAQRALAVVTWLNLMFTRGTVLVDDYLGPVTKRDDVTVKPPPTAVSQAFRTYIGRAEALAEQRVAQAPNDPNAQYELGAALGLDASYTATIDGRVMGAFSAARRAYNAHERVLDLAPSRKDAALVVGTYRYLVANLSLPARWMAYVVGFGGGRERGIEMIEEAAAYPGGTEAKFALVLIYNREHEYDKAVRVLRELQMAYPRNRLLWLEAGSTLLRARRASEADTMLTMGLEKFAKDPRPRMGGEEGLWFFKRGAARVLLKRQTEAQADLTQALKSQAREWVHAQTHLQLGKLADLSGDRTRALAEYDRAIQLGTVARDADTIDEANRLKAEGYKG